MRIAQQLYEGVALGEGTVGLITYMRTDSTHLSNEAVTELRQLIAREFGRTRCRRAREYKTKIKNAQEAHEAIRPTSRCARPQVDRRTSTPDQLQAV
jgi:DNA topoisomerase-1